MILFKVIGLIVGAAAGAFSFRMLLKLTGSIIRGTFNNKTALFAATQFLLPFAVLLGCALLIPESLMWVGIGIAATLIICAAVRFIRSYRS